MTSDYEWATENLVNLIKESRGHLTQATFAGWKGKAINFLDELSGVVYEDLAASFRNKCGKKVHEIAGGREYLEDLLTDIKAGAYDMNEEA